MRLRADYPALPIPGAHEYWELNREVDPQQSDEHLSNILAWKRKATIGKGAPFILLPKESKAKRLVFEVRWEEPVIQKEILFALEVYSERSRNWKTYETWPYPLPDEVWVLLANESRTMAVQPASKPKVDFPATKPADLHKYTGTKDDLKKKRLTLEPSYIDYPESGTAGDTSDVAQQQNPPT